MKDQIEVATAAHFLEEAADNSIYVYYINFDESEVTSSLFFIYQKFSDVFNERTEEVLPSHCDELDHIIELLLNITLSFRPLYNLSEEKLQVLKNYIDQHL